MSHGMLRAICYTAAFVIFVAAGSYMLFGEDKALGALGVLCAAILARVLILNIAEEKYASDQ